MNSKFNILIVEDELLIAKDIKDLLEEDSEFNTLIVRDYNSAISYLETDRPDLIIIDIYLGKGKSGLELGYYLMNLVGIPFIYLTSYNDKYTIDKVISTRPSGFLTKPFKKIDILTTVQIALNVNNVYKLENQIKINPYASEAPYIIKNILKYISKNIENKIEIDDLARLTKWKKHHFIRIFTSYMGVSPYCYVLNLKIDKAKKLIEKENVKLEAVAYDLGFQSYVNFARTFKKYTKLSPKEYRNKQRLISNNN